MSGRIKTFDELLNEYKTGECKRLCSKIEDSRDYTRRVIYLRDKIEKYLRIRSVLEQVEIYEIFLESDEDEQMRINLSSNIAIHRFDRCRTLSLDTSFSKVSIQWLFDSYDNLEQKPSDNELTNIVESFTLDALVYLSKHIDISDLRERDMRVLSRIRLFKE